MLTSTAHATTASAEAPSPFLNGHGTIFVDANSHSQFRRHLLSSMSSAVGCELKWGPYSHLATEADPIVALIEVNGETAYIEISGLPSEGWQSAYPENVAVTFRSISATARLTEHLSRLVQPMTTALITAIQDARGDDFRYPLDAVKDALTLGHYRPEIMSSLEHHLANEGQKQTTKTLVHLLRKAWRILGASIRCSTLFSVLERRKDALPHDALMFCAAYYCEAGDYNKSLDLAQRAIRKEPAAWKWNRYLGLMNLISAERLGSAPFLDIDAENFRYLMQNQGRFIEKLRNAGSFAIVGNSPILLGQRNAPLIDSHDVVVRFNSAPREYPLSLDCGRKLDVLVMNPDYAQTRRPTGEIDLIVLSNGDPYSSKNLSMKLHDLRPRYKVELLPSWVDRATLSSIHASPSSGLKTLQWVYSELGPISKSSLFGFSFNDQLPGNATSYANPSQNTLNIIHNWDAEYEHFCKLVS